jgi:hypothetical protein
VVYYTEGDDAPLSDDELRGQSVSQTAVDAFLFGVSPVAAATRRCALDVANQYTYVMTLGTHQHLMAGRAMLNSLLASDTIRLAPGALLHDPALAGLSPRHVIHWLLQPPMHAMPQKWSAALHCKDALQKQRTLWQVRALLWVH